MYNEKKVPLPVMTCASSNQIKAYVNPTRIVILNMLIKEKRTVTSVAKELNVHPANLTHHFKLLEKAGLIKLVEKRDTGKNLEKYYRAVAINYIVSLNSTTGLNKNAIALSILNNDLTSAISNMQKNDNRMVTALLASVKLLPNDVKKLVNELKKIIAKYKKLNNEKGIAYNINLSTYPNEINMNPNKNIIVE